MAKLHSNIKKYSAGERAKQAIVGEKNYDSVHFLGTSAVKQRDATKAAEQAAQDAQAEADKPAIPLPDEEELARLRRRRGKGGGRAATVLTDDSEKLGG
jgi:hypothetical protein